MEKAVQSINPESDFDLILLAGGVGRRMKTPGEQPKQFALLGSKPLFLKTLETFLGLAHLNHLVVAFPEEWIDYAKDLSDQHGLKKKIIWVKGGKERQDSSFKCLQVLSTHTPSPIVMIHDAVRPFVRPIWLHQSIESAALHGAATLGCNATDTLIEQEGGFYKQAFDRNNIVHVQTPQTFQFDIIYEAHLKAINQKKSIFTDDTSLLTCKGYPLAIVKSSQDNFKITTFKDLLFARFLLQTWQ